ncbi:DUF4189 domain-containing protein [Stenotrophomonas sp. TWI700]|uniref:DUF4189 domain-containing protein n=1 Tax=Stenotrophomonas sp. TWI700 TaxID=3136792 RepID=UPI00320A4413
MFGHAVNFPILRIDAMRVLLALALSLTSLSSFAEGRCPPGQYPIGDHRAPGCAPIPTAGGGEASSPVPTGKWEKRWGAIAEDVSANARKVAGATGVSESRVSKQDAIAVAMEQCIKGGGEKCEVRIVYNNQCVALADPANKQGGVSGESVAFRAQSVELASSKALEKCAAGNRAVGGGCHIVYAACSMSEFKSF